MDEKQIKAIYSIYAEYWKLLRKYIDPIDSEDFWNELTEEIRKTHEQFIDVDKALSYELAISTYGKIRRIAQAKEDEPHQMDITEIA